MFKFWFHHERNHIFQSWGVISKENTFLTNHFIQAIHVHLAFYELHVLESSFCMFENRTIFSFFASLMIKFLALNSPHKKSQAYVGSHQNIHQLFLIVYSSWSKTIVLSYVRLIHTPSKFPSFLQICIKFLMER